MAVEKPGVYKYITLPDNNHSFITVLEFKVFSILHYQVVRVPTNNTNGTLMVASNVKDYTIKNSSL